MDQQNDSRANRITEMKRTLARQDAELHELQRQMQQFGEYNIQVDLDAFAAKLDAMDESAGVPQSLALTTSIRV